MRWQSALTLWLVYVGPHSPKRAISVLLLPLFALSFPERKVDMDQQAAKSADEAVEIKVQFRWEKGRYWCVDCPASFRWDEKIYFDEHVRIHSQNEAYIIEGFLSAPPVFSAVLAGGLIGRHLSASARAAFHVLILRAKKEGFTRSNPLDPAPGREEYFKIADSPRGCWGASVARAWNVPASRPEAILQMLCASD